MVLIHVGFLQLCSAQSIRNRGQNLLMLLSLLQCQVNFAVRLGVTFCWKSG